MEIEKYWIPLVSIKHINKIKIRAKFAENDEDDYVCMQCKGFKEELEKIRINGELFVLIKKGRKHYLLEEHIAKRDWLGVKEKVVD